MTYFPIFCFRETIIDDEFLFYTKKKLPRNRKNAEQHTNKDLKESLHRKIVSKVQQNNVA